MAAKRPSAATSRPTTDPWRIFKRQPGIVLGFHGCDRETGEALLAGDIEHLEPSENKYDWLGSGIYFWESDPWRARQWAEQAAAKPQMTSKPVTQPYVVGAVVDLGFCFNLLDVDSCAEALNAFDFAQSVYTTSNRQMPENKGPEGALRFRDRLVIETVHVLRRRAREPEYDSVRAAFPEGGHLYDGAGFQARSHIQIAVRNRSCIKGYFRLPRL